MDAVASRVLAELSAEAPVFDAHADSLQRALDLGHDLGVRGPGHLDLVRAREGGLSALVFVSWVDPKYVERGPGAARERTLALLGEFHRLARRHPDLVVFAGNARDLECARGNGALAGIPGIEGGHSIEGRLEHLDEFFERGVRVLTLVWNNHLEWIRSCQEGTGAGVPEGLSAFGREVVVHMNALGMVVDLSHAGRRAFFDALEASQRPAIASHSGCRALHDHPRNLDDDQLRALAQHGGVAGIVFCPAFLDADARAAVKRLCESDAYKAIDGANDSERFLRQSEFLAREAPPLGIERVVDHICHAVEIAGVDHVGLGSDYDGIQHAPRGLEGADRYLALVPPLVARGFSLEDVRKVLGANMRRVFAAVTGRGTRAHESKLAATGA
jgi:membrane dipeptidase